MQQENVHLFKLSGALAVENFTLKKNWIWDALEINWNNAHVTLNDREINLPGTLTIPLVYKLKVGTWLGSLASGVIGLAFEGISSFLHHKRHKALTKAGNVMKEKSDLQHNRVYHLEILLCMINTIQTC